MKKFILSTVVIVSFLGYLVMARRQTAGAPLPVISSQASNTPTNSLTPSDPNNATPAGGSSATPAPATPAPTPAPSSAGRTSSSSSKASAGQYKNGTYTGQSADAFYGNVQVKAVIQNGRLTDVQVIDYPSDRSTSRMINSQALPQLISEAIQVQSAQVDFVSGATDTSGAFQQSLASALSQAS